MQPLTNEQFDEVYRAWLEWTPEGGGGDTLFADMAPAYELLSDTMKHLPDGLVAVHDGAAPYLGGYGVAPPAGQTYPRNEHGRGRRQAVAARMLQASSAHRPESRGANRRRR